MTRVHGLKHVQRLATAHLSDHDPVGAHTKAVDDQIAYGYFAATFDVRRARFQGDYVVLPELKGPMTPRTLCRGTMNPMLFNTCAA